MHAPSHPTFLRKRKQSHRRMRTTSSSHLHKNTQAHLHPIHQELTDLAEHCIQKKLLIFEGVLRELQPGIKDAKLERIVRKRRNLLLPGSPEDHKTPAKVGNGAWYRYLLFNSHFVANLVLQTTAAMANYLLVSLKKAQKSEGKDKTSGKLMKAEFLQNWNDFATVFFHVPRQGSAACTIL